MKIVYKNPNSPCTIKQFDTEDFKKNPQYFSDVINCVSASWEYANDDYDIDQAKDVLSKWNEMFFGLEEDDGRLFVLFQTSSGITMPVGFAIFSKSNIPNAFHLEIISTHYDYTGMGYAQALLKASARSLRGEGCKQITSIVNNSNIASQSLHESFARQKGVDLYCNNLGFGEEYVFDISNISQKSADAELAL